MNTSPAPLELRSKAPVLVGKSDELVDPVTYVRFRSAPTATAVPASLPVPPRNVE
jgi:hypothetical protein